MIPKTPDDYYRWPKDLPPEVADLALKRAMEPLQVKEAAQIAVTTADGFVAAICYERVTGDQKDCLLEALARARIVAASPRLLGSLQDLLQHITFDPEGDLSRAEFDAMLSQAQAVADQAAGRAA
ncbi:hypothetical protein ABIC83_002979 [Roseateles asaccharophilus]|uniref:hypothetical protein n=1 Tax=Roseateles asaccharophilus TaxID=582607 RepID=UPI003839B8EF